MSKADVILRLEGEAGGIGAEAFHDALGASLTLLADAERGLIGTTHRWTIGSLEVSSAIAGLKHPDSVGILDVIDDGFRRLSRRAEIPEGWTTRMVERVSRIGNLVGRDGLQGVSLSFKGSLEVRQWNIDSVLTDHAVRALEASEVTIGTITGMVDRWTIRSKREISILTTEGVTVHATWAPKLDERVRHEAVGKWVSAWGRLERNATGQPVQLLISDFTVREPPAVRPISELRGLMAWTGLSLDEWMQDRDDD